MSSWELLIENRVLTSGVAGWFVAQVLKTLIHAILTGRFQAERLVGSGGMPSSHASTVCAMAAAALRVYGEGSFEFAITVMVAIIVMHDAMGVRLETGKQAKLLNEITAAFRNLEHTPFSGFSSEKLKEFVGHTPLQVLAGAILGILIGAFMP
ncbi:MAG: divergent PAP2 family protein [Lachnospiraceae bacterium]|nr:divergent PAP2 family protein [Lachnospiraceae bacterium]